MKKQLAVLCIGILFTSTAVAAGDPEQGKAKSQTCVACHNADGNSTNPMWPKLAGQHAGYIEKQLADFKKGEARYDPQMAPMVAGLSEQDMADLAAYFSQQELAPGYADPNVVEQGEALYRGGNPETGVVACIACHGPRGVGVSLAGFPSLTGQHAQYTEKTLRDFRMENRKNDMNTMMRSIAARMTDQEIAAVAQYIQGLH